MRKYFVSYTYTTDRRLLRFFEQCVLISSKKLTDTTVLRLYDTLLGTLSNLLVHDVTILNIIPLED